MSLGADRSGRAMISLLLLVALATPLVDAVRAGDAAAVRALLSGGADVNGAAADGATALHWAVYADDEPLVHRLLDAGARANAANDLAITPLHLAAANGNDRIVGALLDRGAPADVASTTGVTPLMEAARVGSAAVIRRLAARGARVDAREAGRGQTALMWAAARGQAEAVRALIEAGADIHARSTSRRLTVMLDRGPSRTVKTSMQDAHATDEGGLTALLFAARAGDVASAARLLAAGADPDDAAANGMSALTFACFAGRGDVARLLLENGARPDDAGAGYTALHAAALRGDLPTVRALIARGADVNARITNGSPVRRFGSQWALPRTLIGATPLVVAAAYLETGIMEALLAAGADPSIGLEDGTAPLHLAAGAEVEREARPIDLARFHIVDSDAPVVPRPEPALVEAARLLLDAGADVNQATAAGDMPLHAAAGAGLTGVIQVLAERGALLDAANREGVTPLARTLPQPAQPGRSRGSAGSPDAEALLRRLGAKEER